MTTKATGTMRSGRRVYGPAMPSLEVAAHPGALLAEELAERGMTQSALAKAAGRPFKAINEIVNGKKAITAETAIQLEHALGISARTWMNLQTTYELAKARAKLA